jgi:hypothetical protein
MANLTLEPTLNEFNPVHIPTTYVHSIHNSILPFPF